MLFSLLLYMFENVHGKVFKMKKKKQSRIKRGMPVIIIIIIVIIIIIITTVIVAAQLSFMVAGLFFLGVC